MAISNKHPKVLFIGNSHTFVNDLPTLFNMLAYSGGFEADVYEITEENYALEFFADPEDDRGAYVDDALKQETWDFVILQEQTGNAVASALEDVSSS